MNRVIATGWGYLRGDKMIWMIVIFLFILSMLAVYSATGTLAYKMQVDNESYLLKQIAISIVGLLIMFGFHLVDYKYYSRIAQLLWYISIPLLIYTMIFGLTLNGALRSIRLPVIGLTFQPSDLAKVALIMFLARQLSLMQERTAPFKEVFIQILIPVGLTCLLIARDNLSTALILYFTSVFVMFIGRIAFKNMAILFGASLIFAVIFIMVLHVVPEDTLRQYSKRAVIWKHRIDDFAVGLRGKKVNFEEDYQVQQAKIAIAKGGLFKINPGGSDQRNFLPEAYNDFIYVIIIEEYGLFGGVCVVLLYLLLLYRCIRIVIKAPKAFGALLAVGLGIALVTQAMINMAVAVNLLPVTGVTLPLVSMGGSSVIFTSIAFGIILSVSKNIESEEG